MSVLSNCGGRAVVMQRGCGLPVHVLGAEITIKISSADTGGAFTVFEGRTAPLQGPPLHRHQDHDEWWYIVDGEFRFEVDGEELRASAGDTVFAPRGSRHTFQNIGSTPGRTVTTVIPGGIDTFFQELEKVAPRGTTPEPERLLPVFAKHRQELLGPPLRARGGAKMAGGISAHADEGAIEGILTELEAAWNRSDSASTAAQFAEDATFIQIFGGQLDGRAAIEASHRHIFDTIYKGSRAHFQLRSIRFLRPEVAIVFARARVDFQEDGESRAIETRPTLMVVKREAQWQILAFQNTRISEMPEAAQAAARLAS